jgi:regulator of Ty1 transposition protein 109
MSINLRDAILAGLSRLPGTREFHLHVLVSSPRKHAALFPFAMPRPRSYLQDILILLSEQPTPDSPRILVTAVEACVYNIPSTSCAILYVSKVDSTGHAKLPSPTVTVVRSLLTFYTDPATRPLSADNFWIHLFARAQAQYLFPNSAEFPGKHPLSDIKLCAWWRRVLSDVAVELETRVQPKLKIQLHYILPGYSESEAGHALKFASSSSSSSSPQPLWTYGHPYSQSDVPLPCPPVSPEGLKNLGHFIPSFDDDPKSRFMDEIAYTATGDGIKSPARKRSRTSSNAGEGFPPDTQEVEEKDGHSGKEGRPLGELTKVSPDEFWERMSFRQECIAGAVTGFFTMGMSCLSRREGSPASPLAPQPGQVSSQINKRVMTSLLTNVEFSTVDRAIRATETLENAIKGLCEGITPTHSHTSSAVNLRKLDRRTPERETSSQATLLAPPVTPPPRIVRGKRVIPDVSPNPFPEPVTSLETYHSHIYRSIWVSNPTDITSVRAVTEQEGAEATAARPQPQVTVLTARKKKKRTE